MTSKSLDQIERELRAMTEPPQESVNQPTDLWKRALERARAEAELEERTGLVHPGAERDMPRVRRPMTPGRRLLLALNGVGVAAMVVLAAGVWTVMRTPPMAEKTDLYADTLESAAAAAPGEGAVSLFSNEKAAIAEATEPEPVELALRDGGADADLEHSSRARMSADAAMDRAMREEPEGLPQMEQAFSSGLTFDEADASAMAAAPAPSLESAEIVIEVADLAEARQALDELAAQGFAAFNSLPIEAGVMLAADTAAGALAAKERTDPVLVNVEPARMDAALEKIRGLGRVVEEQRAPDSADSRSQRVLQTASQALGPNAAALQEVAEAQTLDPHERAHRNLTISDEELLGQVRTAIETLSRRLDEARRSMNFSQIRVNLKEAPESDTMGE